MNYPDGGSTPTTVARDLGHTLVQAHQQLAHTGVSIIPFVAVGVIAVALGLFCFAITRWAKTHP